MSQLLCPTLGYSVYFGLPPAFLIASIMSREPATGTDVSASPWKHQHGISLIASAVLVSPRPQIGTIAAQRSGCAAARLNVPMPPMLSPVRDTRLGSVLYSFSTSSSIAIARLPLAVVAPQPNVSACGMIVMNGNVFSCFLIAGPMPTAMGSLPLPFVSPAP